MSSRCGHLKQWSGYLFKMSRIIKLTESDLVNIVEKMMPEITLMGVARVEAYKKYNPANFDVIDEYIVKLRLTFDGGVRTLNGSNEYYGEEINKLFHFTYPDYEFVKFSVDEMDVRPEKTNYEKFIELFSK